MGKDKYRIRRKGWFFGYFVEKYYESHGAWGYLDGTASFTYNGAKRRLKQYIRNLQPAETIAYLDESGNELK